MGRSRIAYRLWPDDDFKVTKKTTEITEDTENDYNSVISEFSVVDYSEPIIFYYSIK
jgi:hypothetical protein